MSPQAWTCSLGPGASTAGWLGAARVPGRTAWISILLAVLTAVVIALSIPTVLPPVPSRAGEPARTA